MVKPNRNIQVAIVDDHSLLRNALAKVIHSFEGYEVSFEAANGKEIRPNILKKGVPDIVILDVNMPEMDGFESTKWMHTHYPQIKVLVLSMLSDERTIIRMLRLGAKGYLLKSADPEEMKSALDALIKKDVYLPEDISGIVVSGLNRYADREEPSIELDDREKEFMQWLCSEMSYKEIADRMRLSLRTVEDLRHSLFTRLKVHSRVGLVLFAIRNGIVAI